MMDWFWRVKTGFIFQCGGMFSDADRVVFRKARSRHRLADLLNAEEAEGGTDILLCMQGTSGGQLRIRMAAVPTFLHRILLTCYYIQLETVTHVVDHRFFDMREGDRCWLLRPLDSGMP